MNPNAKIEYRIRPVTRYIITRFESDNSAHPPVGSRQIGNEYDSADTAYQIGYAVCKVEHEQLGWPIDDDRIQYPREIVETAPEYLKAPPPSTS